MFRYDIFNDFASVIVTPFMAPTMLLMLICMGMMFHAIIMVYKGDVKNKDKVLAFKKRIESVLFFIPIFTGAFYGTLLAFASIVFQFSGILTLLSALVIVLYGYISQRKKTNIAISDRPTINFVISPMVFSGVVAICIAIPLLPLL